MQLIALGVAAREVGGRRVLVLVRLLDLVQAHLLREGLCLDEGVLSLFSLICCSYGYSTYKQE